MSERRYDTEVLILNMKREQRSGVLMIVAGVVILGALTGYFVYMSGPAVPNVPTGVAAEPLPKTVVAAPIPTVSSTATAAADEAATLATLEIDLPRPGTVWFDAQALGKELRQHSEHVAAGKHVLKAKMGKMTVQQPVEVQAGKRYRVSIDVKRRKVVFEPLASP